MSLQQSMRLQHFINKFFEVWCKCVCVCLSPSRSPTGMPHIPQGKSQQQCYTGVAFCSLQCLNISLTRQQAESCLLSPLLMKPQWGSLRSQYSPLWVFGIFTLSRCSQNKITFLQFLKTKSTVLTCLQTNKKKKIQYFYGNKSNLENITW